MGCSRPLTTEAGPCWSQGGHKIADIGEALAAHTLALIEVVVPRDDSSAALKRMGEELGKLRDKNKRG